MNPSRLRVGIIGGFQIGKSTLVNCLLDGKVARTGGMGISVTAVPTRYIYGNIQGVQYMKNGQVVHSCRLHNFLDDPTISSSIDEVVITLWKPLLKYIDLIDTPGFKANEKDTQTTQNAIKEIDFAIVLLNNKSLDSKEVEIFSLLHQYKKPFLVLVNCINQGGVLWDPAAEQNKTILAEIAGRIRNIGSSPILINNKEIWSCNLIWYWYASEHYLKDSPQQIEFIEKQTEFFITSFFKLLKGDYKAIAEKSNFLAIRSLFDNEEYWGFPFNFMEWNSVINKSFVEWQKNIKSITDKI